MSYIVEMTARALDNADWTHGMPAGSGWQVVNNKNNDPQDFNQGAEGKYIYIYYQTGTSGKGVAAMRFITGKDATAPTGWQKVDVDLNDGAGGQYIYLCYQKNSDADYIATLQSGYGDSVESAFCDFGRSAVVLAQDLNEDAKGKFIYLGYYFN